MLKKIPIVFIILLSTITVFANNANDNNEEKNIKDSSTQNKINTPSRNAIKFNYLETNQHLSNTIYENNGITATQQATKDSAKAMFSTITRTNAWINFITSEVNQALPFGITRTIESEATVYEVGFNSIKFTKDGAIARVFARVLPNGGGNGELYFAGNVNLSRVGGVGNSNALNLIGNYSISYAVNAYTLHINAGTGANASTFSFNCNGFTSLNLQCNVSLNNTQYFPVNSSFQKQSNTAITSNDFNINIVRWGDLLKGNATFTNQIFGSSIIPDYFFNIQEATIDLSTLQNPATGKTEIANYIAKTSPVPLLSAWQGIAITSMNVYLPAYFNNGNNRTVVNTTHGIIDNEGFSFRIKGNDILNLSNKSGNANGWPFSITEFNLWYEKSVVLHSISYFKGRIVLPVEDRTYSDRGVPFTASFMPASLSTTISNFTVTPEPPTFITAKSFFGYLLPDVSEGIELTFQVKNNLIYPEASLSGKLSFSANTKETRYEPSDIAKKAAKTENDVNGEVTVNDIEFQNMVMQTETAPYIRINYMGGSAEMQVAGFAAQFAVEFRNGTNMAGVADVRFACLHFDADVQLAGGKFGGGVGINVFMRHNNETGQLDFVQMALTRVNIVVNISNILQLDGAIDILNDRNYGQGFSGQCVLTVAEKLKVEVGVMFGSKRKQDGSYFQYFNIDGRANFKPAGVVVFGVIKITGFSGGLTFKMDAVQPDGNYPTTVTGVSYVPNENSFLRFRAGILFSISDEKVFSGWGGLEFVFNRNWGLEEVSISGNAQLFSQEMEEEDNEISPLTKGRQETYMSYKAAQGQEITEGEGATMLQTASTKRFSGDYLLENISDNKIIIISKSQFNIADTFSVVQRMQTVKQQLDSAITLTNRIKNNIEAITAAKDSTETIIAAMRSRYYAVTGGANSTLTNDFNNFMKPDLGAINSFYHNSYRQKHPVEWQQICTLLNIPFIPNGLINTQRATYTVPTQARINFVRDSLNKNLKSSPEANARVILRDTFQRRADRFESLRISGSRHRGNPTLRQLNDITFTKQWGYRLASIEPRDVTKAFNDSISLNWRKLDTAITDSASIYKRLLDSTNAIVQLGNSANIPILEILNDKINFPNNVGWQPNYTVTTSFSNGIGHTITGTNTNGTKFTLLNEATINYNYYVNILVPQFKIEDSITAITDNTLRPLYDSLRNEGFKYNLHLAQQNNLSTTYYDSLVVVNNYNILAAQEARIKLKQAAGRTLTAEDNTILANATTAYNQAAPIFSTWVQEQKIKAQKQLNESYTNGVEAIAVQRAIIASSTSTEQQKNTASQLLNSLLIQYRVDSTQMANNLLKANGGVIFNQPTPLELHHINKNRKVANPSMFYNNLLRYESQLKQADVDIKVIKIQYNEGFGNLSNASYNQQLNRLLYTKTLIRDSVERDIKVAVRVIAHQLLNNPTVASKELFEFRSKSQFFPAISASIDTAQAWLDRAFAFIKDSVENKLTPMEQQLGMRLPAYIPEDNPKFWGSFLLKIDIRNSAVSVAMDVYTSIAVGGKEVIKGNMDGFGKAGTLDLLVIGNSFKLNIGTKEAPCSVELAYGSFLRAGGTLYLELTNQRSATSINSARFRLKFGISGRASWGGSIDLGFADAYASIGGSLKFDLDVAKNNNFFCSATNTEAGLNGWYGRGDLEVRIYASAGLRIAGVSYEIFGAEALAKLTVVGPNPLYINGRMTFRYNVIGYRGSFGIGFEYGTQCVILP